MSSISYLDRVAGTGPGRAYKRRLLDVLDLRPGQVFADIGSGPGTDLADLADAVGGAGLVLQHLADPARAVADLRRVLRPGGRVALAEPDWDTLAIDAEVGVLATFLAGRVRNPDWGGSWRRVLTAAGFDGARVEATAILLDTADLAEQVLGLRRNTRQAVAAGVLSVRAARRWLDEVAERPRLACFTLFTATASVTADTSAFVSR